MKSVEKLNITLPLTKETKRMFESAMLEGKGDLDMSAVVETVKNLK